MKITSTFRVFKLEDDKDDQGFFFYLRESEDFPDDFANENEAIQHVMDNYGKTKESFLGEFVILNIKKFSV